MDKLKAFFSGVHKWFHNAYLRFQMVRMRRKAVQEMEERIEFENMTEGAFSFVPAVDMAIEKMLVKRLTDLGFDPQDGAFVEHLKVRKRPTSLTWEIDDKPVMMLSWTDTALGEVTFRLKEVLSSGLTLITRPTDIKPAQKIDIVKA